MTPALAKKIKTEIESIVNNLKAIAVENGVSIYVDVKKYTDEKDKVTIISVIGSSASIEEYSFNRIYEETENNIVYEAILLAPEEKKETA